MVGRFRSFFGFHELVCRIAGEPQAGELRPVGDGLGDQIVGIARRAGRKCLFLHLIIHYLRRPKGPRQLRIRFIETVLRLNEQQLCLRHVDVWQS